MRAYNATPAFTSADELFWWCSTVARRIVIDDHRKHARVSPVAEPMDTVDERGDPAGRYERQQLVRAVLDELAQLPDAQRAAIARADNANDYVRRHRARRRLLAVVEAFGAAVLGIWQRLRVARHAVPLLAVATIAVVLVDTAAISPSTRPLDAPARPTPPRVLTSELEVTPRPTSSPPSRTAPPSAEAPRRPTIDPPVQAGVSAPTPAGELRTGVREGPPGAPLDCLHLGSLGRTLCVDYPRLP